MCRKCFDETGPWQGLALDVKCKNLGHFKHLYILYTSVHVFLYLDNHLLENFYTWAKATLGDPTASDSMVHAQGM